MARHTPVCTERDTNESSVCFTRASTFLIVLASRRPHKVDKTLLLLLLRFLPWQTTHAHADGLGSAFFPSSTTKKRDSTRRKDDLDETLSSAELQNNHNNNKKQNFLFSSCYFYICRSAPLFYLLALSRPWNVVFVIFSLATRTHNNLVVQYMIQTSHRTEEKREKEKER